MRQQQSEHAIQAKPAPPPARRSSDKASPFADIELELTQLIFDGLMPTILQGSACLIGLTAFLAYHYADLWMGYLALLALAVCSARILSVHAFHKRAEAALTIPEAIRWQNIYGLCTVLYCCTMAVITVHCFRHHDIGSWAICGTGVFALTAGIATRQGLRPRIAQANVVILILALAVSLLSSSDPLVTLAGLLLGIFALLSCNMIRKQFRLSVEQIRGRRQLLQLAQHDTLTGLANRRCFQTALAHACHQTARPFAVLYIDLDRFKAVNDTFGHATGDLLLHGVAQRLKQATRAYDVVARLGGDEFAILQQAATTVEDAQALAARIVRDLSEVFEIGIQQVLIGASIGIRLSTHGENDPLLLLSKADRALYTVKQSGGGGFALTDH